MRKAAMYNRGDGKQKQQLTSAVLRQSDKPHSPPQCGTAHFPYQHRARQRFRATNRRQPSLHALSFSRLLGDSFLPEEAFLRLTDTARNFRNGYGSKTFKRYRITLFKFRLLPLPFVPKPEKLFRPSPSR